MWGLFERRFKSILERLQRHRSLLDMESTSIHFSEMQKQREDTLHYLKQYEAQNQTSMVEEVFRWLSADAIEQEEALYRLADQCLPGTCDWIFREQGITDWLDANGQIADKIAAKSMIWLKGIPGSGTPNTSIAEKLRNFNLFHPQAERVSTVTWASQKLATEAICSNLAFRKKRYLLSAGFGDSKIRALDRCLLFLLPSEYW
jgi:hypothetical protein